MRYLVHLEREGGREGGREREGGRGVYIVLLTLLRGLNASL